MLIVLFETLRYNVSMNTDSNYYLIIAGILAIVVELLLGVATGFDLLLIGVIAITAGVVGLLTGSFQLAIALVFLLTILYVLIGRSFVRSKLKIATKATNVEALMGKKVVVVKKITSKVPGQVKVEGEIWRASSSETLDEGEEAVVHSVSGVTLQVKK